MLGFLVGLVSYEVTPVTQQRSYIGLYMLEGKMLLQLHSPMLLAIVTGEGLPDDKSTIAGGQEIRQVLKTFEKGDPGWKVRMKALVQATTAGADAVAVLVESLETGVPSVREFAAHALSIIADPRTEPALAKALDDPDRGVRIYAIRALSGLGKLKLTDDYREAMRAASSAWPKAPWMPDYLEAAENPQHSPNVSAKRKALLHYDLSKMGTARPGERAADFVLKDRNGNDVRLSDFRDKATVILEFNDGGG
jgi:HEAT repeats